ncbi:unnamed protein product [Polarella glacialis]|uniref:Uncharacterized protein n=1 Tax=Polarella glacialis TaxID=89957 RepID=A0A813IB05_POLGL|nr:unnamed protein product [Polarella glacialis]
MDAGKVLSQDGALQDAAESLLEPLDQQSDEFFQEGGAEFMRHLQGDLSPRTSGFCFPGYQAACLMRVLRLAALALAAPESGASYSAEANAQTCANFYGKDFALEYMSSTSWPVRLLDLQVHIVNSPGVQMPMRLARTLPTGVETYDQLRQHWPQPPHSAQLTAGSVDPQGLSKACLLCRAARVTQQIRVLSVDGGHCALWLEPAITLRALFPGIVTSQLASYSSGTHCLDLMGKDAFGDEPFLANQEYFGNNPAFRAADVLVGQWVGECAKLRTHYSKPVIAYLGFLLLNDPSVGQYHAWSEPLEHFWERLAFLDACDVHSLQGLAPADGGPPCAAVYEEPQLAEAAHWQTGRRKPSVRPLSLYVRAVHDPSSAVR